MLWKPNRKNKIQIIKIMKILKFPKRIIAVWMILSLNWGALALTQTTRAEFIDFAEVSGTAIGAGSLDFSAQHSWSFHPDSECDPQTEICPGWGLTDTVNLTTAGTLDFQYTISIVNAAETASSTLPLCDNLTVNGVPLKNFASVPMQYSTSFAQALAFSLTGDDEDLQDQTCNFDYSIKGWQTDVAGYGQGFFVERTISSSITSDPWMVEAPAGENETGGEDEMEEDDGEGGDTGGGSAGALESEDEDIDDTADGDGQIQEQGEENQEGEGDAGAEDGDEGDSADNDDSGGNADGGDQNAETEGAGQAEGEAAGESAGGGEQQGSDAGGVDMGQAAAGGNENTGGGDGGNAGGDGGAGSGDVGQGSGDAGGGIGGGDAGAGGDAGGGSEGGAE